MSADRGAPRTLLRVRVVPRAAREKLGRGPEGVLRVHLTAPPVEGAANRTLVSFLAARLGLPKRALVLAKGERGRDKIVAVEGESAAELEVRIARALGSSVDKTGGRG